MVATNGGDALMGLIHSPRIVTDGLVFCVDAADTRSYPGTGTTWTDRSVSGNNGTLTNGPTFSSDNRGSIVFDGSNDYVELIATGSEYNFSNISVGCWFKTSTTSSNPKTLVSKMSNVISSLNGWDLTISGSNGNLTWTPSFNGGSAAVSQDYIDGNWHYAVGTHDGTNAKIYVDGVLKDTASNSNTSNSSLSVFIGAWGVVGSLAYYTEANIASVHIYNKTLDDSEVLQNYLATKGRYT